MKKLFAFVALGLALISLGSCSGKDNKGTTDTGTVSTEDSVLGNSPIAINEEPAKGKPGIIKFSATWCGPCKTMEPIFEAEANKYGESINFVTIDVDEREDLADKYGIQAVPTFVFLDENGNETNRLSGAMSEDVFENAIVTSILEKM